MFKLVSDFARTIDTMAPTTRGLEPSCLRTLEPQLDEPPPATPPRQQPNRLAPPPRWLTERPLTLWSTASTPMIATPPTYARRQDPAPPARASKRIAQSARRLPHARAQPREDFFTFSRAALRAARRPCRCLWPSGSW